MTRGNASERSLGNGSFCRASVGLAAAPERPGCARELSLQTGSGRLEFSNATPFSALALASGLAQCPIRPGTQPLPAAGTAKCGSAETTRLTAYLDAESKSS